MTSFDDWLPDLFDVLNLANTDVYLLGDNGILLGEMGLYHSTMTAEIVNAPYDTSLKVPLVCVGPGFPAGLSVDAPTLVHDVTATLYAVAGVAPALTAGQTGIDLRAIAADPDAYANRVCAHILDATNATLGRPACARHQVSCEALSTRLYKFVRYPSLAAPRTVTNGVTNSTATVTSATAAFVAGDVGVRVYGTDIPASTYVGIRNSATSIGLSSSGTSNVPVSATGTHSGNTLTIGDAKLELYDLVNDPKEQWNRAYDGVNLDPNTGAVWTATATTLDAALTAELLVA